MLVPIWRPADTHPKKEGGLRCAVWRCGGRPRTQYAPRLRYSTVKPLTSDKCGTKSSKGAIAASQRQPTSRWNTESRSVIAQQSFQNIRSRTCLLPATSLAISFARKATFVGTIPSKMM